MMARPKVLTAADAARLIPDGAIVTVSPSSALGCPDAMLAAIGARFDAEGHPRDLTTLHPIAAGDMWGVKGIDHLASPGCLARVLAGSYPSGHATVGKEAFGFHTECVVHLDSGIVLRADSMAADAYLSADQAASNLEKRLRRYHRRLKDNHGNARGNGRTPDDIQ